MRSTALEKRLEALWENQLPFVVFRLPESQKVSVFFQDDNRLHTTSDFTESGFVMTPFVNSEDCPFIPDSKTEHFTKPSIQLFNTKPIVFPDSEQSKQEFLKLVQTAKEEIAQGKLEKVVLSRFLDLHSEKKPQKIFLALENKYTNALTYLWHHPLVGSWLGATPEQFVEVTPLKTHTMALAGTQVYNPSKLPLWSKKEKEEQGLVTQQVLLDLKTVFNEDEIEYSEPTHKRAGNLVHLCTHFSLPKLKTSLKNLTEVLHPTPAVGGVPKKEAKNFILSNEGYNRSFYTGFLGPITTKKTSLFVNLRCAAWKPDRIRLYVGAGITSSSDSEQEWLETQRKAETLAQIV